MIGAFCAFCCVVRDISMQLPSRHTKKENSTKGEWSVGMTTRPSQSLKSYWAQLWVFGQMCIGVYIYTQSWHAGGWHCPRCMSWRQVKYVSLNLNLLLISPKNTLSTESHGTALHLTRTPASGVPLPKWTLPYKNQAVIFASEFSVSLFMHSIFNKCKDFAACDTKKG